MFSHRFLSSLFICSAVLAMAPGCPTDTGPGDGDGDIGDGDGDVGDGDGDGAIFEVERQLINGSEMLAGRGLGVAVLDDGRVAVAFMRSGQGQFECELLGGGMVEGGDNIDVTVAIEDGQGGFTFDTLETVPGAASQALDLAAGGNELFVAYGGGETANGYCGSSDLAFSRGLPGSWATSLVATDSGDSATECRLAANGEDPYCDIGDTVGLYPSVAVDTSGTVAIAFQDFHNGFADKDIFGADLEIALGSTSFAIASISTEAGAGYHTDVAFGADGRTIVGHEVLANNQFVDDMMVQFAVAQGLYVAVEQADGTFIDSLIGEGVATDTRVAVGHHPSVGWVAAYHDNVSEDLIFWVSNDDGVTWTPEPIDQLGLTGRSPSIGWLTDGRPVVSYRYCAGAGENTCQRTVDRVRVAVRNGAGDWDRQDMPHFDEQADGAEISMATAPDGTVVIASSTPSAGELVLHRLTLR